MINKLSIHNFQSHKKTELKFSPGVNIIVGRSDTGKSAIIRSLKWAINNRPLGDAFRSHWGGETSVKINFDDCEVIRSKDKKDFYRINSPKDEQTELTAFGTSVPEEVSNAINLEDLNIQNQVDPSFLISDNPGEVSRHFNKIANLEEIDISLKFVERTLRSLSGDKKSAEREVQEFTEEVESYDYLDEIEEALNKLQKLEKAKNKANESFQALYGILKEANTINKEIQQKKGVLTLAPRVDRLLELSQQHERQERIVSALKKLLTETLSVHKEIKKKSNVLRLENGVLNCLEIAESKKEKNTQIENLSTEISKFEMVQKTIHKAQEELNELEIKWTEHFPSVCPLCNQSVDETHTHS